MFFRINIINILDYIWNKLILGFFHRRNPQRARIERSHEFEVGALQLIITGEHFGTRDNGNMVTWCFFNPMGFKADGFAVGGFAVGLEWNPEIFSKFRVFFCFGVVFFCCLVFFL